MLIQNYIHKQIRSKARVPYLAFALVTVCPKLPEPLFDHIPRDAPENSIVCVQTQNSPSGLLWTATLQDADTTWFGPQHPWQGEIGTIFHNDLEALTVLANKDLHNDWKSTWIVAGIWTIPFIWIGIMSYWNGNTHYKPIQTLEGHP